LARLGAQSLDILSACGAHSPVSGKMLESAGEDIPQRSVDQLAAMLSELLPSAGIDFAGADVLEPDPFGSQLIADVTSREAHCFDATSEGCIDWLHSSPRKASTASMIQAGARGRMTKSNIASHMASALQLDHVSNAAAEQSSHNRRMLAFAYLASGEIIFQGQLCGELCLVGGVRVA